jgi:hypothetical protein
MVVLLLMQAVGKLVTRKRTGWHSPDAVWRENAYSHLDPLTACRALLYSAANFLALGPYTSNRMPCADC